MIHLFPWVWGKVEDQHWEEGDADAGDNQVHLALIIRSCSWDDWKSIGVQLHTLRLVHYMQSKDKEYDQSSANSRCRKEFCDEASKKRQCRDKVPERRHNQWGVLDIGFLKMLQSFSFVVWSDLTWEPICNDTLSLVNCPTRWPLHCQMKYSAAMYYAELEFDSISIRFQPCAAQSVIGRASHCFGVRRWSGRF